MSAEPWGSGDDRRRLGCPRSQEVIVACQANRVASSWRPTARRATTTTSRTTYEAGLVLTGTEVKSLRAGRASLVDGFADRQRRRGLAGGRAHPGVRPRHLDQPRRRGAGASCCCTGRRSSELAGGDPREGPDPGAAVAVLRGRPGQGRDRAGPGQEAATTSARRCASGRTGARRTARWRCAATAEAAAGHAGRPCRGACAGARGRRTRVTPWSDPRSPAWFRAPSWPGSGPWPVRCRCSAWPPGSRCPPRLPRRPRDLPGRWARPPQGGRSPGRWSRPAGWRRSAATR